MRHAIVFGCLMLAITATAQAAKPVIRLGGQDITDVEVNLEKEIERAMAPEARRDEASLVRAAVTQILDRKLLVQAAREAKIGVTPNDIKQSLAALRALLRDPIRVAEMLSNAGATDSDLEKVVEEKLLVDKLIESTSAVKITTSEQEARTYYNAHPEEFQHPEQIKVWTISLAVPQGASAKDDDAIRRKAAGFLERLKRGEDFAKVATGASEAGGGGRKGLIGWARQGMLPPEVETLVWYLGEGELTPVLRLPQGYAIFWVEKRRGPGTYPFDEVKGGLLDYLKAMKVQQSVGKLLEERRKKAVIQVLDPVLQGILSAGASGGGAPASPQR